MLDNIKKYDLILGSQSPRRAELLKGLHLDFKIISIDVDEVYPASIVGVDIPMYLAELKAAAFKSMMTEKTLLITADTIVWHEGFVLGKPKDKNDAKQMLQKLSGKTHQVITGVSITALQKQKTFHVISDVRFSKLTDSEIDFYLDKFEPYDKAGSYGVQEWIGYIGVEHINGSYYNVMGLPVQRLYNELKRWK